VPETRPFVVLYTSREGSSAIVDQLSRHPAVFVPAREHLDLQNVAAHVDNPHARVGELLRDAFTRGRVPGVPASYRNERTIGFKWRPFGAADAVAAMRRHRCVVFYLYRRDALARALSVALSPVHAQFAIANMPDGDRPEALRRAHTAHFVADPAVVTTAIRTYRDQKALLWDTYCADLGARLLDYESFAADPLATLNRMLHEVGVEPFTALPPCRYYKTTSDDIRQQCDNIADVGADGSVRAALDDYARLLERIGARPPRRHWLIGRRRS
jgi:hypothetical protein